MILHVREFFIIIDIKFIILNLLNLNNETKIAVNNELEKGMRK